MNRLKIGGKNRPFKFTADAFEEFSIQHNVSIAGLTTIFSDVRIDQIYDLTFLGLSEGARVSNIAVDFDRQTVKQWMNGKLAEIMGKVISFAATDMGIVFGVKTEDPKKGNLKEVAEEKQ